MKARYSRPVVSAFTLIELLTVIAIIGILAAIIIPTVGKVRKTARNAQCANNLRQWGQAVQLYANDHKGNYVVSGKVNASDPSNTSWIAVVSVTGNTHYGPYFSSSRTMETLRDCPLLTEAYGSFRSSYMIARPYLTGTTVSPADKVPLNRAQNPSRLLLFIDIDPLVAVNSSSSIIGLAGLNTHVVPLFATPAKDRHDGGVNAVFADGHIRRVTATDIANEGETWTRL